VKGPVSTQQIVGKGAEPTADYLVAGGSPRVGLALQSIAGTDVRLIKVRTVPSSSAGGAVPLIIVSEFDSFLKCQTFSGDTVYCLKPISLRADTWKPGWTGDPKDAQFVNNGSTYWNPEYALTYIGANRRIR